MSPSEKHKKAEEFRRQAIAARKLLDRIKSVAEEGKDGEYAVTAGRRLERIHGLAGEARDHIAILAEASVDELLAAYGGDWEEVK